MKALAEQIADIDGVNIYGRVVGVRGLMVEIAGPIHAMSVGARIVIDTGGNRFIPSEVIGFSGSNAVVMPFAGLEGVRRGCRAVIANAASQVRPSPLWLGRVLNAMGEPIDGKGPLPQGASPMPFRNTPPAAHSRKRVGRALDLGVRALNTFLTCCRGQRLGIFAGSGVGKSVLLSMLARNVDADITVIGLVGERGREDPQQAAAPCRLEGTGASQPDLIQDARGQRGRGVRWAGVVVGQMACRGEHRGVLRPPAHPQRGRVGGEETTDLREHGPGIVGLLRDLAGWQPLAQRVELRGISSGRARRPDQVRPRPVLIEHRRPGPGQDAERGRGDDALAPRGVQGPADVHHCLRPGLVSVLGRSLLDGDLVVPVQDPVPECLVDPAGAAHAKARQLGRAQRPHRGAAEHVDASLHDPHDFLVPHRGNASTAIDDADDAGTGAPQAVHVPGRRWGQADRV